MNISDRFTETGEQWTGSRQVWMPDDIEPEARYYALAPDSKEYVRRFALRLRNGKSYSIPYAMLPIIELDGKQFLSILTHDLNIKIRGRNLYILEEALSEERVLWIRECLTGKDTGEDEIYISEITIVCDFID